MKIQLLHLSDMHFEKKEDSFEIKIDKMLQAIDTIGDDKADECIIVVSGDLAAKGSNEEYKCVNSLLGALFKTFGKEKFPGKRIEFICVPGNHDVNLSNMDISFETIKDAYSSGAIDSIMNTYIDNMGSFFGFAQHRKCFLDDMFISKKVVSYGDKKIGFVMLNTAPLSILGGNAEDMGSHYLTDEQMTKIEQATDADINILVMHHSIEWFHNSCKERLRKIISKKYSLILSGHEHEPVGESRNTNGTGSVQYIQGNALHGYATEGNGFCVINMDLEQYKMTGYSFLWRNTIYVPKKILDGPVKICLGGDLMVKPEFIEEISKDSYKRNIDDYYVFPGLIYNIYKENEEVEKHDVETESELNELIAKHSKIYITGEHKAGKTILAKKLFISFLREGKAPLLITASDINKKKIEKTIEYVFEEQYENKNDNFELFRQIDKSNKIVLLDEANLISTNTLTKLLDFLEINFGKIIVFSEDKIDLNIRKQVVDLMAEADTLNLTIKQFLYVKRKKLIGNILAVNQHENCNIEKETTKINELINAQIKFFHLNPEFIINFVNQYEKEYRFQFSSGLNVFSVVYESSIRNRIIASADNINVTIVLNVLRELAFYMHFGKKKYVKIEEISEVAEQYGRSYRQKVNIRLFIDTAVKAKILVDIDNEIRFRDHTVVAYFVAQALNHKYNQDEDISDNLTCLLKNLCFSINSDIVLFLALITNNPKFVNVIIEGAIEHFAGQEELSFDNRNVNYLLDTSIPVKNSLPTAEERKRRDEVIEKQEEN